MAKLEGFRLVNVHANHNSIVYPNEYFFIDGKNALLDMKNGGGKTLAAQMLFQTVLPNSFFSDKNKFTILCNDLFKLSKIEGLIRGNIKFTFSELNNQFLKANNQEGTISYSKYVELIYLLYQTKKATN